MIESKFNDLISTVRKYTNSINRKDVDKANEVVTALSNIINRLNFYLRDDIECKILENRLVKELRKLSKELFIRTNNKTIYLEKLQRNIDFLTWINKSRNINRGSRTYTVAQKEIFYAYLGDNIGSEQNGRRPVIILQNNTGNRKGNTTIICPVTTHQKRIKWDKEKQKYYVRICDGCNERRKYLDFYEVPLRLEGKEHGLYGFVNVMHIREIDRKRIDSTCVGKATDKCFENIIKAINRNLG